MKKFSTMLLSVGIMAIAAGCSSDVIEEGPAEHTGAIAFGTTNVSKDSRAQLADGESMTTSNLTEFYVYGNYTSNNGQVINVFTGEKTLKDNNDKWSYDGGLRYWVPGLTYNFYAFSCGNTADIDGETGRPTYTVFSNNGLEFKGYECHNHDLVLAEAEGETRAKDETTPVHLKFKHILTRLKFSFNCITPGDEYTIELSAVKLRGQYKTADFDGEKWTNHSEKSDNVVLGIDGESNVIPSEENEYLACKPVFVIPNKYADNTKDVILSFTMTIKYRNEVILERAVEATWTPNWLQGHSMNNVVKINFQDATGLKPIEFTAEVVKGENNEEDGWTEAEGGLKDITFTPQATPGN